MSIKGTDQLPKLSAPKDYNNRGGKWAWLRDQGVTLPEPILTQINVLSEISDRTDLVKPEKPSKQGSLIARGHSPDEASQIWEDYEKAASRYEDQRKASSDVRRAAQHSLERLVQQHINDIIDEGLNPKLVDLVEKARPHAQTLQRFAPNNRQMKNVEKTDPKEVGGFHAEDMAYYSEPKELKAFQAVLEDGRLFLQLLRVYADVLRDWSRIGGNRFHPGALGGVVIWSNPEAVKDLHLRGQGFGQGWEKPYPAPLALLTIAYQPLEAGFRLLSPAQNEKDLRAADAEREQRQKEAARRGDISISPEDVSKTLDDMAAKADRRQKLVKFL